MPHRTTIESAIIAHRAWVTHFRQCIESSDLEQTDRIAGTSNNECEFGRWLHGEDAYEALGEALFMKIVVLHQNFHRAAGKVAEALLVKAPDAEDRIAELQNYSNLLVAELRSKFPSQENGNQ